MQPIMAFYFNAGATSQQDGEKLVLLDMSCDLKGVRRLLKLSQQHRLNNHQDAESWRMVRTRYMERNESGIVWITCLDTTLRRCMNTNETWSDPHNHADPERKREDAEGK